MGTFWLTFSHLQSVQMKKSIWQSRHNQDIAEIHERSQSLQSSINIVIPLEDWMIPHILKIATKIYNCQ